MGDPTPLLAPLAAVAQLFAPSAEECCAPGTHGAQPFVGSRVTTLTNSVDQSTGAADSPKGQFFGAAKVRTRPRAAAKFRRPFAAIETLFPKSNARLKLVRRRRLRHN